MLYLSGLCRRGAGGEKRELPTLEVHLLLERRQVSQ